MAQTLQGTVSVALCTYNGERFLQQQLDSIAAQTRLPDELVICDDLSNDQTLAIAKRFARSAPFSVHLHSNTDRKGSTLNFNEATVKCQGDIIILCDQDDFWYPHKLDTLVGHLETHPQTGLVFSDAHLASDSLELLPGTLWRSFGFALAQQKQITDGAAFDTIVRRNVVTGATVAFRQSLVRVAHPFPDIWFHDNWLALIAAAITQIECIDQPLMMYRQHSANQIGASASSLLEEARQSSTVKRSHYQFLTQRHIVLLRKLEALNKSTDFHMQLSQQISTVNNKISHLQFRASLDKPALTRIPAVLIEALKGRYFRYSNGVNSLVKDLLYRNG